MLKQSFQALTGKFTVLTKKLINEIEEDFRRFQAQLIGNLV